MMAGVIRDRAADQDGKRDALHAGQEPVEAISLPARFRGRKRRRLPSFGQVDGRDPDEDDDSDSDSESVAGARGIRDRRSNGS